MEMKQTIMMWRCGDRVIHSPVSRKMIGIVQLPISGMVLMDFSFTIMFVVRIIELYAKN